MSDSALMGSDHLSWLWAIAAIVPAIGAVRALKRSGAERVRPAIALQIALALALAGLVVPALVGGESGVGNLLLGLPGALVAPASLLLLALGASERGPRLQPAIVWSAVALPAVALLALAAPPWWGGSSFAWVQRWLERASDGGGLSAWATLLPLTFGASCLLAAAAMFVRASRSGSTPDSRRAQYSAVACLAPLVATAVCAAMGARVGFEPVWLAYLVPSVAFGWILYPTRDTRLSARMAAIDALGEAVVIIDGSRRVVDANARAIELLDPHRGDLRGCDASEALAAIPNLLALLEDPSTVCTEFFTGKTAGTRRCHEARIHKLESGESEGSQVIAIRDITSSRVAEDKLFYQAHFDSLTGLPNRRLFLEKIAAMLNEAKQEKRQVALMYLDFDHFKEINDSLGHSAGDELLRIMAHRLRQHLRSSDTLSRTASGSPPEVSRLGGDEFAILMSRFSSTTDIEEVAKRIITLVADPVTIGGQCVHNACSIGVAIFPDHGTEIATLVKNADSALYYAKNNSRGQFQFYRPEFGSKVVRKASLEKELRGAIEAKELTLHYQPKIDIQRETVAGAEALLRWENPRLGVVPPKEFIPVAEESGQITSIGAWVIDTACAQIKKWRKAGLDPVPISVNVSCYQFTRMDLRQIVASALDRNGVSPDLLELELTESALLEDNDQTASCLRELRTIGVKVSLDDFGTGYSALSYLSRVPLDVLKMDRAFIRDVHSDPSAAGVASAVVAMAHSLNLRVVAEGVDCAEQIAPLRNMGCDLIQGFIFSAAVAPDEFGKLLTPEGRQIDVAAIERPAITESRESAADVAEIEEPEIELGSHALIVDDEKMQIGRTAMRMNQMGIPSYYARDADEGLLFALQESGRIRALFVSADTPTRDVERIAAQIAEQSNTRPSIVVVGEAFDAEAVGRLRDRGPIWSLRIPFDDAELKFVADAALAKETALKFPERNRAPVHILAWTRFGDETGYGVITSLSARGAFIEMDDPLPVGTAIQLEFSLADWPCAIRARVVYLHGTGADRTDHPPGVGVVFLDRDRETEDRILEEIHKRAVRYAP